MSEDDIDNKCLELLRQAYEAVKTRLKEIAEWRAKRPALFHQEEYQRQLSKADPENDELFPTLVNRGFELYKLDEHYVAREFGISLDSVQRWRDGSVIPHPFVRPQVYAWLAKQGDDQ
jgi:hypothetical protein